MTWLQYRDISLVFITNTFVLHFAICHSTSLTAYIVAAAAAAAAAMSLKFLNMKGWHPANKTNQRRIWIAEQNARDRAQREQEAAVEVRQSAELQRFQQLAAASSGDPAAARRAADQQQLGFMYAPPPGLPKPNDAAANGAEGARWIVCLLTMETVTDACWDVGADDDADVAAFRRKVDKCKKVGEAAAEDPREGQRNLERYVGRRPDENLTIKAQVERFPFLKDAPVEGQYTDAVRVNFKPMGKQLRNVRCMRCGEWGHQSGDRECALRDANPHGRLRLGLMLEVAMRSEVLTAAFCV